MRECKNCGKELPKGIHKDTLFCNMNCYSKWREGKPGTIKIVIRNTKWKSAEELMQMTSKERHYWQFRDQEIERNRKYQKKERNGNPIYLGKIRKHGLLKRYGPEAILKVEKTNGKCEKCGTICILLPSWQSLHRWAIHHINFNEKDNRGENLCFLCGKNHNDIHHYIPVECREDFFKEWMERKEN